ncbi:hypothetical protein GGX14DRAFT_388942 [Mycena pura]|uniref:Uncharacterized protein n=1 Tax=Mycena pura TaxID=153505 RepID=A0AAD6VR79_9AGAR|nr:hypothetical protein GGX14DRAFT_388942 [Mycena pura]
MYPTGWTQLEGKALSTNMRVVQYNYRKSKASHECHGFKPVLYSRVFRHLKSAPVSVPSGIRTALTSHKSRPTISSLVSTPTGTRGPKNWNLYLPHPWETSTRIRGWQTRGCQSAGTRADIRGLGNSCEALVESAVALLADAWISAGTHTKEDFKNIPWFQGTCVNKLAPALA